MKENTNTGARDLLLDTLAMMGCSYELSDNGSAIFFWYQGQCFVAMATNDSCFVDLYDTHWQSIDLNHKEEVSRMKKCINEANRSSSVYVEKTIDKKKKKMLIHLSMDFIFNDTIEDKEGRLRTVFDELFRVHHIIDYNMIKLKEEADNDIKTIIIVNQI